MVPDRLEAEAKPRVEVAIHWVELPVVSRICPRVPEALVPSNRAPVNCSLPATVSSWAGVDVPMPTLPFCEHGQQLAAGGGSYGKGINSPAALDGQGGRRGGAANAQRVAKVRGSGGGGDG